MKRSVTTLALILYALALPVHAFAGIEEINWLPRKVFSANGFDSNDQTQITLHGRFPDSCYRASTANFQIEGDKIIVTNKAFHQTNTPCFDVIVPWTTTLTVGLLPAGKYEVQMVNANGELKSLDQFIVVEARSIAMDDYLYAYINSLMVKVDRQTRIPTITLSGSFGMNCMYLKEVRIIRDEKDAVAILPIVGINNPESCAVSLPAIPFRRTIVLAQPLLENMTLFHVRSLNGQAINQIVEF